MTSIKDVFAICRLFLVSCLMVFILAEEMQDNTGWPPYMLPVFQEHASQMKCGNYGKNKAEKEETGFPVIQIFVA